MKIAILGYGKMGSWLAADFQGIIREKAVPSWGNPEGLRKYSGEVT